MRVSRWTKSYYLPSILQLSQDCHVNLSFFPSQAQSVLALKERRAKTACPVRVVSVWVMCSYVRVLSSPLCLWPAPPILQARTLSISSHYSVTWNHRAKKPNQLLRLLNESNFLPESTRRAHTSMETLNYLTLIQINKSHCHQDCATTQWQTMTVHLNHCMRTATYSIPQNTVNNLI